MSPWSRTGRGGICFLFDPMPRRNTWSPNRKIQVAVMMWDCYPCTNSVPLPRFFYFSSSLLSIFPVPSHSLHPRTHAHSLSCIGTRPHSLALPNISQCCLSAEQPDKRNCFSLYRTGKSHEGSYSISRSKPNTGGKYPHFMSWKVT